MDTQDLSHLPDVLTVEETAAVLRLGRNTVYEAIRDGTLPSLRIGRRILVSKISLLRLLNDLERPAKP